MSDDRLLKSYVWHGDKCFFVSTIRRDSSAMVAPPPPRFDETMVWEWDWDTQERGEWIVQVGDGPAFEQHMSVCRQLFETGTYEEAEA